MDCHSAAVQSARPYIPLAVFRSLEKIRTIGYEEKRSFQPNASFLVLHYLDFAMNVESELTDDLTQLIEKITEVYALNKGK